MNLYWLSDDGCQGGPTGNENWREMAGTSSKTSVIKFFSGRACSLSSEGVTY